MTSKIVRGVKLDLSDPAKTEIVPPTATAYKILTGKSMGVFNGDNISDSVSILDDDKAIEGLEANPGFIIHNLVPSADIFTQLPIAEAQVDQSSVEPNSTESNSETSAELNESDELSEAIEPNLNPVQGGNLNE